MILKILFSTIVFSIVAQSEVRSGKIGFNIPVYMDLSGSGGFSKIGGSTSESPTLIQWQLGATLGLLIRNKFWIGGTSTFSFVNQLSEPTSATGNWTGSRWNLVSPTIGIQFEKVLVKLEYQILGDYRLKELTGSGASLVYSSGRGGRATVLVRTYKKVFTGLTYEFVDFGVEKNSVLGDRTLSPTLRLWQIGLVTAYVF